MDSKAFLGDQIYHRPDCLYNLMTCLAFFSVLDNVAWRTICFESGSGKHMTV